MSFTVRNDLAGSNARAMRGLSGNFKPVQSVVRVRHTSHYVWIDEPPAGSPRRT